MAKDGAKVIQAMSELIKFRKLVTNEFLSFNAVPIDIVFGASLQSLQQGTAILVVRLANYFVLSFQFYSIAISKTLIL